MNTNRDLFRSLAHAVLDHFEDIDASALDHSLHDRSTEKLRIMCSLAFGAALASGEPELANRFARVWQ